MGKRRYAAAALAIVAVAFAAAVTTAKGGSSQARTTTPGTLKPLTVTKVGTVDVGKLDTRMELFGETYGSPIVIAPTGSNQAFHNDGELGVSRAARAGNHLTMLSTVAGALPATVICEGT